VFRKLNKKTIDIKKKSVAGTITTRESELISDEGLKRRITVVTECFTGKFPELVLNDRNSRLQ
jgi:hypothetical protein